MFEKFSVIDLIKTRSASVCTFAGNVVKFNVQTAQELRFPEYIQFLIEPKSKHSGLQKGNYRKIKGLSALFIRIKRKYITNGSNQAATAVCFCSQPL